MGVSENWGYLILLVLVVRILLVFRGIFSESPACNGTAKLWEVSEIVPFCAVGVEFSNYCRSASNLRIVSACFCGDNAAAFPPCRTVVVLEG